MPFNIFGVLEEIKNEYDVNTEKRKALSIIEKKLYENKKLKERNDSLKNRDINLCRIANGIKDENIRLKSENIHLKAEADGLFYAYQAVQNRLDLANVKLKALERKFDDGQRQENNDAANSNHKNK